MDQHSNLIKIKLTNNNFDGDVKGKVINMINERNITKFKTFHINTPSVELNSSLTRFINLNYGLVNLDLSESKISSENLINILKLERLKKLTLNSLKLIKLHRKNFEPIFSKCSFSLISFKFNSNNLVDNDIFQFTKLILQSSKNLEFLDLSKCFISSRILCRLFIDLKNLNSLNYLNISGNNYLNDKAFIDLLNSNIFNNNLGENSIKIYCINNQLKSESFLKLLQFSNLEILNFSSNKLENNIDWSKINFNGISMNLRELHLKNCNINDKFLNNFTLIIDHLIKLNLLDLSNNSINNDSLINFLNKLIDINLNLKQLFIYHNNLTLSIIYEISKKILLLKNLLLLNSTNLLIHRTNIDVNSIKFNLSTINLILNDINEINRSRKLNVSSNQLNLLETNEYLMLLQNLNNLNIHELIINDNLSDNDIIYLVNIVKNNNSSIHNIKLANNFVNSELGYNKYSNKLLNSIISLNNIVSFEISSDSGFIFEWNFWKIVTIQKHIKIIKINKGLLLSDKKIYPINANNFCSSIECLKFEFTQFSNNFIKYLKEFLSYQKNLQSLAFNNCLLNDKVIFDPLKIHFQTLIELNLIGYKFVEDETKNFQCFLSYQTNLKVLNLSFIDFSLYSTRNIFSSNFNYCFNLKELHLDNCVLSNTISFYLKSLISHQLQLEILSLANVILFKDIGINLFKNFPKDRCRLIKLNLSYCTFSPDMASHLGKFINYQKRLKYLNLSYTNTDGVIGRNLFKKLSKNCKNIIYLDLKYCNITGKSMAKYLGKFISYQQNLKVLILSEVNFQCRLTSNWFKSRIIVEIDLFNIKLTNFTSLSLGFFLGQQKQLQKLNLSNIMLDGKLGKEMFSNMYSFCCNISSLNLSACKFSPDMAKHLSKFLQRQNNLTFLDLSRTDLSGNIGIYIFSFKFTSSTELSRIKNLNLMESKFSDDMTLYLGQFINRQKYLTILNLSYTDLRDNIGKNLLYQITANCSNIIDLDLRYCRFTVNVIYALTAFLENQKQLKFLNLSFVDSKCLEDTEFYKIIAKKLFTFINLNIENCNFSLEAYDKLVKTINKDNLTEEEKLKLPDKLDSMKFMM